MDPGGLGRGTGYLVLGAASLRLRGGVARPRRKASAVSAGAVASAAAADGDPQGIEDSEDAGSLGGVFGEA